MLNSRDLQPHLGFGLKPYHKRLLNFLERIIQYFSITELNHFGSLKSGSLFRSVTHIGPEPISR
jgi:hypothetical protein